MKTIEHVVSFPAPPARVYAALVDARQHAAFTGAPAENDPRPGGLHSAYGGAVHGINLDLAPDQRIVQAWRAKDFPAGVFTLATFVLAAEGAGTKLTFSHVVPDEHYDHLNSGWTARYWTPLRAYLAST